MFESHRIDRSTGATIGTVTRRQGGVSYHPDERSHIGIKTSDMTHSTSPLRRFADVIVHKLMAGTYDERLLDLHIKRINFRDTFNESLCVLYDTWTWLRNDSGQAYIVKITNVNTKGFEWTIFLGKNSEVKHFMFFNNYITSSHVMLNMIADIVLSDVNVPLCEYGYNISHIRWGTT